MNINGQKENTMDVGEIYRTGAAEYDIGRLADKLERKLGDACVSTGPGYGFDGYLLDVNCFAPDALDNLDMLAATLSDWQVCGGLCCDQLIVRMHSQEHLRSMKRLDLQTRQKIYSIVEQEARRSEFIACAPEVEPLMYDFLVFPGGTNDEYGLRIVECEEIACLPYIFDFIKSIKKEHNLNCFLLIVDFQSSHL